jgi:hypothetical protein
MGVNVLPGNIRNKIPVSVAIPVQNQTTFLLLVAWAKALTSKKKPQLKRHIEAWKPGGRVQFHRGEIVDPELAFLDHSFDLRKAELGRIVVLQSTASDKAEVAYSEDDRFEDWPIGWVERAIDEDMVALDLLTHCLPSGG